MTAFKIVPDGPEPERRVDPTPIEEWPPPSAPLEVAYALAEDRKQDGVVTLQKWRETWWEYKEPCWAKVDEAEVRGWVYNRLRDATYVGKDRHGMPEEKPWNPDRAKVTNVLDAFATAVACLPERVEPGTWLPTRQQIPGVVATPTGLFSLATRQTTPATPQMFTTWALPFSYDPNAPEPTAWLHFLNQQWAEEPDTIAMLQEWMGYLISGRTDMQKAMLLLGERRGGKGTILYICQQLVGEENTSTPTLANLADRFGLERSIGKTLIAIGDARLGKGTPTSTIVERILSITGEDGITVDIKNRRPWHGRLPARIMIASNDAPDFRDASGAVNGRFLIAKTTQSFYNREDPTLRRRLLAELPGIFKWALDGLDRLNANGRFTESATSIEERESMEETGSPVAQFIENACVLREGLMVPRRVLYAVWRDWAEQSGYTAGSIGTFGRMLESAQRGLRRSQPTIDGERVSCYAGIGLRERHVGTQAGAYPPHTRIRNPDVQREAFPYVVPGT